MFVSVAVIDQGTFKGKDGLEDLKKSAEESLKKRELELQMKSQSLEEANTALKVLADKSKRAPRTLPDRH